MRGYQGRGLEGDGQSQQYRRAECSVGGRCCDLVWAAASAFLVNAWCSWNSDYSIAGHEEAVIVAPCWQQQLLKCCCCSGRASHAVGMARYPLLWWLGILHQPTADILLSFRPQVCVYLLSAVFSMLLCLPLHQRTLSPAVADHVLLWLPLSQNIPGQHTTVCGSGSLQNVV